MTLQLEDNKKVIHLISLRKIRKPYNITLTEAVNIAKTNGITIHKTVAGDKALNVDDIPHFAHKVKQFHFENQSNPDVSDITLPIPTPTVVVPTRETPLEKTIIYSGPTNSGKTFHGLKQLFEDYRTNPTETHVYCGPLRLLAYEVYLKMCEQFGEENVGFITGEEAINPDAKLLATTCEMTPKEGHSILIDEAHWLIDTDRGDVWGKLITSHQYKNLYIITASEAIPLIEQLLVDSETIEHQSFSRKTPVEYGGTITLKDIQPKTAVVCFSRKTVYIIARELEKMGKKVGVLYGSLPLNVRKTQIQNYIDGNYDVIVTTDVIGHGINLPIDNLVFVQTEKFDGKEIRSLKIWETAQIAGRAGRFGLSNKGTVYLAEGLPWFSSNSKLIKQGVAAANGKIGTDLNLTEAYISPTLGHLNLNGLPIKHQLMLLIPTLKEWKRTTRKTLKQQGTSIIKPSELSTQIKLADLILGYLGCDVQQWEWEPDVIIYSKQLDSNIRPIELQHLWQLISGPFDPRLEFVLDVVEWLIRNFETPNQSDYLKHVFSKHEKDITRISLKNEKDLYKYTEQLEEHSKVLGEMKMVFTMLGSENPETGELYLGSLTLSEVKATEQLVSDLISQAIARTIVKTQYAKCQNCGKNTMPWFNKCDSCYIQQQYPYN